MLATLAGLCAGVLVRVLLDRPQRSEFADSDQTASEAEWFAVEGKRRPTLVASDGHLCDLGRIGLGQVSVARLHCHTTRACQIIRKLDTTCEGPELSILGSGEVQQLVPGSACNVMSDEDICVLATLRPTRVGEVGIRVDLLVATLGGTEEFRLHIRGTCEERIRFSRRDSAVGALSGDSLSDSLLPEVWSVESTVREPIAIKSLDPHGTVLFVQPEDSNATRWLLGCIRRGAGRSVSPAVIWIKSAGGGIYWFELPVSPPPSIRSQDLARTGVFGK